MKVPRSVNAPDMVTYRMSRKEPKTFPPHLAAYPMKCNAVSVGVAKSMLDQEPAMKAAVSAVLLAHFQTPRCVGMSSWRNRRASCMKRERYRSTLEASVAERYTE